MRFRAIKALPYRTRQLLADDSHVRGPQSRQQILPGDIVEVNAPNGKIPLAIRLLVRSRKLQEIREPTDVPAPPPAVAAKIAAAVAPPVPAPEVGAITTSQMGANPEINQLRAEYEATLGKRPFMGWDSATLREKIAAAKA